MKVERLIYKNLNYSIKKIFQSEAVSYNLFSKFYITRRMYLNKFLGTLFLSDTLPLHLITI